MTVGDLSELLAAEVERYPEDELGILTLRRATDLMINQFESEIGMQLPSELAAWLSHCNGGPLFGGLYGIGGDDHDVRDGGLFSSWLNRGFFSLAGDGCGDYYLVDMKSTCPGVYFVDQSDHHTLCYAVASSPFRFLRNYMRGELNRDHYSWFDREAVLKEDPALVDCREAPLPWEA